MPDALERLLHELRNTHPQMQNLFLEGKCYNLWLIVRTVFPDAQCWYSKVQGHVYIKYNKKFYDIRGKRLKWSLPDDLQPLDHREWHQPHRWGFDHPSIFTKVC